MTHIEQQLTALTTLFNRYQIAIIRCLTILFALYLISFMAETTWRLLPEPKPKGISKNAIIETTKGTNRTDLNLIKSSQLFGQANATPIAVVDTSVSEAPETRLNLSLTGTVYSNEPAKGIAIIENRGVQSHYQIGEKIEGTNATLRQIYSDRVIIKNGSKNETLMLDGVDFKKMVDATAVTSTPLRKRKPALSREAGNVINKLKSSPESFTEYLSVSRVKQGIRVSPGKDPSLFKLSGLKSGDVVTELNGLDLSDMSQLGEAMMAMRNSSNMQLTVKRGEEYLSIDIELPESE